MFWLIQANHAQKTDWVFLNGDVDALFRIRAPGDEALLALIDKVDGRILPIRQASALLVFTEFESYVAATLSLPRHRDRAEEEGRELRVSRHVSVRLSG